jgi:CheY-like chemotaxis protein
MNTDCDAPLKLLIIDDDAGLLTVLEAGVALLPGTHVTALVKAAEALAWLKHEPVDILIADYALNDPAINGLTLLEEAQRHPDPPLTVIITAYASLQVSLQSIQLGAYDFLTKPFQIEELQLVVRNAATLLHTRRRNDYLRQEIGEMLKTVSRLGENQALIEERFKQLTGNLEASGARCESDAARPALAGDLDGPAVQELRRRRMLDQVQGYQRMSETLGEQLTRERRRIESLVEDGLIPQDTFDRAVREGRFATAGPAAAPGQERSAH